MHRHVRLAALLLSLSTLGALGCLGVAGDFNLGVPDATSPAADAGEDATLVEASMPDAAGGGGDVREESVSVVVEAGPDARADADAAPEEAGPECSDGGECTLGPCESAQYTCVDGGRVCASTGWIANGTPCGSSDAGVEDGGPIEVCYNGSCVPCSAGGDCSVPGTCQKQTYDCSSGRAVCEDAGHQPDNSLCDAGLYCYGGVCSPCTVGESCVLADAGCEQAKVTSCPNGVPVCTGQGTNVPNGTGCGTNHVCDNGACVICGANLVCPPSDNMCHTGLTSCATGTSVCVDTGQNQLDFTLCQGTNYCYGTYTCQDGGCTASNPVICPRTDQCHLAGTCNPSTGQCSNPTAANGAICQTSNNCYEAASCQAGVCTGTNPVVCTASDSCHVAGTCDPSTGQCSNPTAGNGTGCTLGNFCYGAASCQSGVCTGMNPVTCAASDQCHVAGTCNPSTGECSNPAATAGTACDAGNLCFGSAECVSGVCTGMSPVTCTASDQCHVAGSCNAATGQCTNPAAGNGTLCTLGNLCYGTATCQGGVCTGMAPVTCTASDQCHMAGTCDPSTGQCSNPTVPDGTGCSTGSLCVVSGTESCTGGVCGGGTAAVTCEAGTCQADSGICQ